MFKKAKKSNASRDLAASLQREVNMNPLLAHPPSIPKEANRYGAQPAVYVEEDELSFNDAIEDDAELARKIPAKSSLAPMSKPASAAVDFQKWIGVQSGAHISKIQQEVRKKNPDYTPYQVQLEAEASMAKDEKSKKSIHERVMPDEKAATMMLLSAYVDHQDETAIAIYRKFHNEQIIRMCGNDTSVIEARTAAVERSIDIAVNEAKRINEEKAKIGTMVVLKEGDVSIDELRQSMMSTQVINESAVDTLKRVRTAQGDVVVQGPFKTMTSLITAYTEDLSMSSEQAKVRIINDLARRVISAINKTAAFIRVAPDNAVFYSKNLKKKYPHPITAMMALIEHQGLKITAEDVTNYMNWWDVSQKTSAEDVEQALINTNQRNGLDIVETEMMKRGVPKEEIRASMAYAIDPFQSHVTRMISEMIDDEDFRNLNEACLAENKVSELVNGKKSVRGKTSKKQPEQSKSYDILTDSNPLTQPYEATARSLPELSRAYLADYMRQSAGALYGERDCINGFKCVCVTFSTVQPTLGSNIGGMSAHNVSTAGEYGIGNSLTRDSTEPLMAEQTACNTSSIVGRHQNGFVCREFLLPDQERDYKVKGHLPAVQGMCVLCWRFSVSTLYFSYMQQTPAGRSQMPTSCLQNYAVSIDQPGEYPHSACLATSFRERPFTGIVRPYPGFSYNHYFYGTTTAHGQTLPRMVETSALSFPLASVNVTRT